ncbi:hypothetical protein [Streptomyces sp. ISL-86]|uniref:hypothetical protein n=1 Tax=Streptomyces sp. ISL-86 TaxID=2819187 RepID=UPI001BE5EE91|nr:hypothetical protein [Streptomyces sp. ISL-86]MBT2458709.1 hypothetical protein [Streptomyces sp. ISL-86]
MTDIDYSLHNKVAEVNRLVIQVAEQLGHVSGQVTSVEAKQQQTRTELQELRDEFAAFVAQARLTAALQRAETRVGVIQDQLDHEFGHHKVVRRTAVGMLQAFDIGLVSEDTVRMVGDQLMLQTPRYWLAPALVALAAWSSDDPALCERAVQECFRRSPDRTSLFFALVLRRQGRHAESTRWLRHYLLAQDPARLGREFAVILESVAQGAFGAAGRDMLRDSMDEWRELLGSDMDAQNAQIERWRAELGTLCPAVTGDEFPFLFRVSPQWPQLGQVLSAARTQQVILDKYTAIMSAEHKPSSRIEDAVDDILDRLVSEYDNDELPLRRDLAYQQAVVAHDGDTARAQAVADADAASYDESLDYLTVPSTAALNPGAIGTSQATRRLAVAACRDWFHHAHQGFSADYRAAVPQDVWARFDATYPVGAAQQFTLPQWGGSFRTPLPELQKDLGDHWDRHTAPFLAALGYRWGGKAAVAVLIAVLGLFIGSAIGTAATVVIPLLVGGVAAIVISQGLAKARKVQDSARLLLDEAKRDALHQLVGASAELTHWQSGYAEADAVEGRVRELIESLSTAAEGNSPFGGRIVSREGRQS